MNYYLDVLRNYATFTGRARRSEYWNFVLFNVIISAVLGGIDAAILGAEPGTGFLGSIYQLFVFIPGVAVAVRRLHDTGRSGWWYLLVLIPIIGWIALIVFYFQDSEPGENQYGPNPKEPFNEIIDEIGNVDHFRSE
ncbi:MAG: DUF805 domain-containing protein [Bacteroidota bacterium]